LSLRDRILSRASSERAAEMEAESRTWMVRCRKCGNERSVWEMGGLRYKARGRP
jgi:ribosomal protein S27E